MYDVRCMMFDVRCMSFTVVIAQKKNVTNNQIER